MKASRRAGSSATTTRARSIGAPSTKEVRSCSDAHVQAGFGETLKCVIQQLTPNTLTREPHVDSKVGEQQSRNRIPTPANAVALAASSNSKR